MSHRGVLIAISAAVIGALGYHSVAASPSAPTATPFEPPGPPGHLATPAVVADGVVPSGVTVFDGRYPAVSKLAPALLDALRRAAAAAAQGGVVFYVDSGWRSPKYQEQLLDEAIAKYGSRDKAAEWVATPETSPHVSGDAVDIGRANATTWLARHGSAYALCQIYRNEPWHYELRPNAIAHGCPRMYSDPTHDPRMQP